MMFSPCMGQCGKTLEISGMCRECVEGARILNRNALANRDKEIERLTGVVSRWNARIVVLEAELREEIERLKARPYCIACLSEPDAAGPGCPCEHAPCIHDRNERIAALEAENAALREAARDLLGVLSDERESNIDTHVVAPFWQQARLRDALRKEGK